MHEVFDFCLKEMFLRVGEDYPNKELTNNKDWYNMRSWTIEEESKFRDWMVGYLRKKLRWTKKIAVKEVSFFLLQYGWTNKHALHMETIKK